MPKNNSEKELEQDLLDYLLDKSEDLKARRKGTLAAKVATAFAREKIFFNELETILSGTFKNKFPVPKYNPKSKHKTERVVNAMLSDLHYGSDISAKETGVSYGKIEEARRTASVVKQIADYKCQYRGESKLNLLLMGDLIENRMHGQTSSAPVAEQVARAIYMLSQSIEYLSYQYPLGVNVYCVPGNHDRLDSKGERTIDEKYNSLAFIIYKSLKIAFKDYKNIIFIIPQTPWVVINNFGNLGYITHGDGILNAGNPGKNINIANITKQINTINAAIGRKSKEFSLFGIGHLHLGVMMKLPGWVTLLINGALVPANAYANHIGIMEANTGQWLFESTKDHIVGDSRFMEVNEEDDINTSLDSIIKPYED